MKLNRLASTFLVNSICTEIQEMKNLTIDGKITNMYDNEGGISIPVNVQPNIVEFPLDTSSPMSSYDLYNMIIHDCVYIQSSLEDALKTVSAMVSLDVESRIYGAMWVSAHNSLHRFNILHPIIVDSLLRGRIDIDLGTKGKLYIYEYTNDVSTVIPKTDYVQDYIDVWAAVFESISTQYQPSLQHRCTTNLNNTCNDFRLLGNLDSLRCSFTASGSNPVNVVTPVALLTRDMLFPYYGVVVSEKRSEGDSYYSRDMTPMSSCNVSPSTMGNPRTWGSTCTGSASNAMYASLRTLCNANTHSAFHDNLLWGTTSEIKMFVKVTQEYSCNLIDLVYTPKTQEETADNVEESTTDVTPDAPVVDESVTYCEK